MQRYFFLFQFPKIAYYCIAKAATDQMNRILAIELAKDGIRVNNVNPGPVRTNFSSRNKVPGTVPIQKEEPVVHPNEPLSGRIVEPIEMATLIAFLANNEEASFVTGSVLVVDGGASINMPNKVALGANSGPFIYA